MIFKTLGSIFQPIRYRNSLYDCSFSILRSKSNESGTAYQFPDVKNAWDFILFKLVLANLYANYAGPKNIKGPVANLENTSIVKAPTILKISSTQLGLSGKTNPIFVFQMPMIEVFLITR